MPTIVNTVCLRFTCRPSLELQPKPYHESLEFAAKTPAVTQEKAGNKVDLQRRTVQPIQAIFCPFCARFVEFSQLGRHVTLTLPAGASYM
jgi:hypothetical protein